MLVEKKIRVNNCPVGTTQINVTTILSSRETRDLHKKLRKEAVNLCRVWSVISPPSKMT
jgi:hypothetical protein